MYARECSQRRVCLSLSEMLDPQDKRKRKNFERTPQSRGLGKGEHQREGR